VSVRLGSDIEKRELDLNSKMRAANAPLSPLYPCCLNLMHGYANQAVEDFQKAAKVVERDTGSVPAWLTSRTDIAAAVDAR